MSLKPNIGPSVGGILPKRRWPHLETLSETTIQELKRASEQERRAAKAQEESNIKTADKQAFTTNRLGGKQGIVGGAFHLMPALAIKVKARVLEEGALKYELDTHGDYLYPADSLSGNWRKISKAEHVNHALGHIMEYLSGDRSEDHLAHAACRLDFAVDIRETEKTNREADMEAKMEAAYQQYSDNSCKPNEALSKKQADIEDMF